MRRAEFELEDTLTEVGELDKLSSSSGESSSSSGRVGMAGGKGSRVRGRRRGVEDVPEAPLL